MKFNFSKQDIQRLAKRFAYSPNNVEKVIRLCLILDDLNSREEFEGKLLLKGGTAINLVAFRDCPRLSVDLDDAEKTFIEKFFNKEFVPEILFDADTSDRLKSHPVALRTLQMMEGSSEERHSSRGRHR